VSCHAKQKKGEEISLTKKSSKHSQGSRIRKEYDKERYKKNKKQRERGKT